MAGNLKAIQAENELIQTYIFYVCILGLKMLLMSVLTGTRRIKLKVFLNQEDCNVLDNKLKPRLDERVERLRRAHQNDIENIFVFFAISFAYILTNPGTSMALMLFRIYAIARYMHTFVYIFAVPQPSRVLAFSVGLMVTVYMAMQVILSNL